MNAHSLPKWREITREERFFTCTLFQDLTIAPLPFLRLLTPKLSLPTNLGLIDIGFEVCFFRDAAFAGLIERHRHLEKQTFDLVLILSGDRVVIVEAKAQQGFHNRQMDMLANARELIQGSAIWPAKDVRLAALCSSRYTPSPKTRACFDVILTWTEMAHLFPANSAIYERADAIYGDTAMRPEVSVPAA